MSTTTLGFGLTLAPAPPGLLPGLGGAAALVQVTGASGAPTLPIEWDTSGSSQSFTLTTPATPTPLGISLGPIFHWVSTSGNAQINLHWSNTIQNVVGVLADIASAGVCLVVHMLDQRSLAHQPLLWRAGVGVPLQPVSTRRSGVRSAPPQDRSWRAGSQRDSYPIPLTTPAGASIPPLNTGALDFAVPSLSITGAPAGTVLHGDSIHLTAAASGGTAPFTYAWSEKWCAVRYDPVHR